VITLTFRALSNESVIFVRGTYFRIGIDGLLRGPDNSVSASYSDGFWHVARKQHRVLECNSAVYLRVKSFDGQLKRIGPYEDLKIAGGEVLANGACLGWHLLKQSRSPEIDSWREIALLSHA
jgi:hypothetical protein